jgi:hypothetical protein
VYCRKEKVVGRGRKEKMGERRARKHCDSVTLLVYITQEEVKNEKKM